MDKWTSILLVALTFGLFSPVYFIERGKAECKTEAIKAGMPADEILKLCK